MIKAVLLDMDNTLLKNPDKEFAIAFLDLFERHFAAAGIENAAKKYRSAIGVMSSQQQGDTTNRQVTLELLSDDIELANHTLDSFYSESFPKLKQCISPVDGAVELIHRLRDADYAVIIATNPIYPETAIRQRMTWAGLPLEEGLYSLITSADNMHFAKPDPAYYAEILGRVGIEPDEAVMVGDSIRNDINPAKQVGLQTFHTGDTGISAFVDVLDDVLGATYAVQLRPEMIEPQFRGNIGATFGFVETVQEHFWHQRPDPEEWSIIQILCHLVTSEEEIERKRLLKILQENNPFITQPEQPGPDIDACADTGDVVVKDFMKTRQETIKLIETFSEKDWQRPARHSIFGLTTMLEMAYFTAQHDRLHLNQLCQTIGRCE